MRETISERYRKALPGSWARWERARRVIPGGITHDGRHLAPLLPHLMPMLPAWVVPDEPATLAETVPEPTGAQPTVAPLTGTGTPPVSGAPVSAAPVSSAPFSGAPVSSAPVSATPHLPTPASPPTHDRPMPLDPNGGSDAATPPDQPVPAHRH